MGVQSAEEVEDELGLRNPVVDVAEGVSEGLDLLTVVRDRHITLDHRVELVVEEDGRYSLLSLKRFSIATKSS
jgi:hypothetical protein